MTHPRQSDTISRARLSEATKKLAWSAWAAAAGSDAIETRTSFEEWWADLGIAGRETVEAGMEAAIRPGPGR